MTSESRAAKDLKDDLGQRTPAVAARTADKYTRNELLKLVRPQPGFAVVVAPVSGRVDLHTEGVMPRRGIVFRHRNRLPQDE